MKKCPYCGKEYPDETMFCAADGEKLRESVEERKKITGVWRGAYSYGKRNESAETTPVAFVLKLEQGSMNHFSGMVVEHGSPGSGTIDGYFKWPSIDFTKQMPVRYTMDPDGVRMTMSEFFLAQGYQCKHDLLGPRIFCQGTFLDANRMQGTWIINPEWLRSSDGFIFPTPRMAGFWCARFVTDDTEPDAVGGPTEALFDKSLLSPQQLDDVEPRLGSLGEFTFHAAEIILNRFDREKIQYDTEIRLMGPIGTSGTDRTVEIFVHPDDMDRAQAIIRQDE